MSDVCRKNSTVEILKTVVGCLKSSVVRRLRRTVGIALAWQDSLVFSILFRFSVSKSHGEIFFPLWDLRFSEVGFAGSERAQISKKVVGCPKFSVVKFV